MNELANSLAYKYIAVLLMVAEANFCASRLHLRMGPIKETDIQRIYVGPPRILRSLGCIDTARYSFGFAESGRLRFVTELNTEKICGQPEDAVRVHPRRYLCQFPLKLWERFIAKGPAPLGDQKEAWWMNDPRMNWNDQSLVSTVTSVSKGMDEALDYVFVRSQLDSLAQKYQDPFGDTIWLPACDLDDLRQNPTHTALLVSWFKPDDILDPTYCVGVYQSKWGFLGIFRHRWASCYCPYADTTSLQIFAPGNGWGNAPPYLIYPDPFGPND